MCDNFSIERFASKGEVQVSLCIGHKQCQVQIKQFIQTVPILPKSVAKYQSRIVCVLTRNFLMAVSPNISSYQWSYIYIIFKFPCIL